MITLLDPPSNMLNSQCKHIAIFVLKCGLTSYRSGWIFILLNFYGNSLTISVSQLLIAFTIISSMVLSAISYHLYNLKNLKNNHGWVLLESKLQALKHLIWISSNHNLVIWFLYSISFSLVLFKALVFVFSCVFPFILFPLVYLLY